MDTLNGKENTNQNSGGVIIFITDGIQDCIDPHPLKVTDKTVTDRYTRDRL